MTRGVNRRTVLAGAGATTATAAAALAAGVRIARAADPVKIGVLFPLTGNAAAAGQASKAAVEIAAEIVNNAHPELADFRSPRPPACRISAAPSSSSSSSTTRAIRRSAQQPDAAPDHAGQGRLLCSAPTNPPCTLTATRGRRALRHSVHGRRFGGAQHHRPRLQMGVPHHADRHRLCRDLHAVPRRHEEGRARKIASIAIVNENTDYGTSVAERRSRRRRRRTISGRDPNSLQREHAPTCPAQVLQLKDKKPDAVIFISYTADSILYMKTMKNLDYLPPMVIGDDTGFSDPSFIPAVADIAQGADEPQRLGRRQARQHHLQDQRHVQGQDRPRSRRYQRAATCRASLALADAINRAGSTDPAKIQDALQETDLKPEQLMMGYRGVKFDETGQNILASTYLIQLKGKEYELVGRRSAATAKLEWPMKGWK